MEFIGIEIVYKAIMQNRKILNFSKYYKNSVVGPSLPRHTHTLSLQCLGNGLAARRDSSTCEEFHLAPSLPSLDGLSTFSAHPSRRLLGPPSHTLNQDKWDRAEIDKCAQAHVYAYVREAARRMSWARMHVVFSKILCDPRHDTPMRILRPVQLFLAALIP